MTLNPSKSEFLMERIEPLGMLIGAHKTAKGVQYGLRACDTKKYMIVKYPIPTKHARVMKEAVVGTSDSNKTKKGPTTIIGAIAQQGFFEAIKQSIKENIITGGNANGKGVYRYWKE